MPTITWRKINGNIPKKARLRKSQAVLEIPNIQLEDSGTYECKAENPRGGTAFKGHLQVYSESLHVPSFPLLICSLFSHGHIIQDHKSPRILFYEYSSSASKDFSHDIILKVVTPCSYSGLGNGLVPVNLLSSTRTNYTSIARNSKASVHHFTSQFSS